METKTEPKRWIQCPSICVTRSGAVFCVKREGHLGDHRGFRAQWNNKQKVKITEREPASTSGGR